MSLYLETGGGRIRVAKIESRTFSLRVKLKPALLDLLMGISRVKSIYLVIRVWGLDGVIFRQTEGTGYRVRSTNATLQPETSASMSQSWIVRSTFRHLNLFSLGLLRVPIYAPPY